MVIISNGFNKFHLTTAAVELNRYGKLDLLITGAYPKWALRRADKLPLLQNNAKIQRLLARGDDVDDRRVRSIWFPEVLHAASSLPERWGNFNSSRMMNLSAMAGYGRRASRILRKSGRSTLIYHYRAGFGGVSVEKAKKLGMITLCDHSIAHPELLSHLVNNGGRMPQSDSVSAMNRFERWLLADIDRADAVLVNSYFVKQTFLNRAPTRMPVYTIYWGVDDQFLGYLYSYPSTTDRRSAPLRLMFAGSFERRKGAEDIIEAVRSMEIEGWHLDIAGPIHARIARRHPAFFEDHRVTALGLLPRRDVARRMQSADVFVFPSLAEGSARVIFEAMACGCSIVTTPNSGSVVEDGTHGKLIAPNDAHGLAQAIQWAVDHREQVAEQGRRNARLISRSYRQVHYGSRLLKLYDELLHSAPEPPSSSRPG